MIARPDPSFAMMDLLSLFPSEELTIPAWQMAIFVVLVSIFMLAEDHKLCLITTYLFTLYWTFFLYFGDLINAFGTFPATLYIIFGLCHVVLTVVAFTQEKGVKS